ncbi:DNA cytosine methyltransferase [Streptomyces triticiradicis]|uniref:DNA (cytosine-5-)-methyltransferase n=1 Tax=Streptomyces triticiradicis TaxID=2651189 RepID=A0A7J5DM64_9ACTN|nr:DNA cytosine methyltransferase [Streptomyces triticiradicis]KAB1989822.1 DNA cytosine methyltransferase [Streptomyces triticiradicis]
MAKVIDLLCGAGGSSTGLVEAGYELILGINHWQLAIDTHAANHRNADHACIDISGFPMRYLPNADVLWASVICTEISPAGGRRRETHQMDLLDLIEEGEDWEALTKDAFERTRVTGWCVVRAAEAKRFKAIVVENVVEFGLDWILFPKWLEAMELLGYQYQIACVSSAHIGDDVNLRAPQWRDRMYVVFTLKTMRKPDLEPRPLAPCTDCGEDVPGVQSWDVAGVRIGKYRRDYSYRCPNTRCGHAVVEPYVRPASDIINWQDLGTRIGDRKKPLVDTTMDRIRAGLLKFPYRPSSITLTHGKEGSDRAYAVEDRPLPTRTAKQGDALLVPTGGSWNTDAVPADVPLRTRTTRESEALLTVNPFIVEFRNNATANPAAHPLSGITAQGNHHGLVTHDGRVPDQGRSTLVVPYRKGAVKTAAEPVHTLSTRDSAALVRSAPDINDCYFRMLKPREQLEGQRFPPRYVVYGNQAEQTMQAGNAVSVNVARWIGQRLEAVL